MELLCHYPDRINLIHVLTVFYKQEAMPSDAVNGLLGRKLSENRRHNVHT